MPSRSNGAPTKTLILSAADWRRVESSYGKKLLSGVRSAVLEATKTLLLLDLLERRAEPVANAEQPINACRKAGENFQSALLAIASSSDAASYVRDLIKKTSTTRG